MFSSDENKSSSVGLSSARMISISKSQLLALHSQFEVSSMYPKAELCACTFLSLHKEKWKLLFQTRLAPMEPVPIKWDAFKITTIKKGHISTMSGFKRCCFSFERHFLLLIFFMITYQSAGQWACLIVANLQSQSIIFYTAKIIVSKFHSFFRFSASECGKTKTRQRRAIPIKIRRWKKGGKSTFT